jgi:Rho termination factor, N-terminal domain
MPNKKSPGPSVKDKKLYEKLRDSGNSKEKSARIANSAAATSRKKVSRKGGRSSSYDEWSKTELQAKAKQVGIKGRSTMKKSELVKALRNH